MYRFLLTRQWVILTLIAVLLIPVMIRLGFWQYHRHEARVARNDLVARNLGAAPVPVGELSAPGRDIPTPDTWRRVTATGSYDSGHEVVVRQRTDADGHQGYFVLTPLRPAGGGATVLVNRGWIPAGDDITAFPDVPKAPAGEVTVTGYLRADETTSASGIENRRGLPDRQVMLINSTQSAADGVTGPVLGGYIQLTGTSPKPSGAQPEPVEEPDHSSIGVHIAYAIQWWIFAAAVPFGWWVLVRRERRDRAAAAAAPAEPAQTATPVA
ncbi:putative SURF1-like protein [Streptomyces sp. RB5]|uniref:SURF1-like protein n=1 Tax=Streptomyces smaragdinus TaxID=2585196 RepID=A0A7K0CHQ5_9ACTN|nr:SURF1 family protein [Streptomyces smaragdinus]MQY12274.1 putative SURF1-like protein [Streptomyces smaragdinus]